MLWETLRMFDYIEPPQYSGHGYAMFGTERCEMKVKIPACPTHLDWGSWELTVHLDRNSNYMLPDYSLKVATSLRYS
jgi:hypothetical protein